jgi:hypothetical protein
MTTEARDRIFISHATPGDNPFAIWLASRLSMAGYEVWCDQEKLLGGEDFWQDIEDEIRNRTIKFVLVISDKAFDSEGRVRDGIKKEIALAGVLKKQLGDDYFIVPVRIDETDFSKFSIDFLRLNGIDCGPNWSTGFAKLLKVLERDDVPKNLETVSPSLSEWRSIHQHHQSALGSGTETLQSNWLQFHDLPKAINFFSLQLPVKQSEIRAIASACDVPCFDHGRLLGSYAGLDELQAALGEKVPITVRGTVDTIDFLRGRTGDILGIKPSDAKNKVTSLIRKSWNALMLSKGLVAYEMSNGHLAWWFPEGLLDDGSLHYTDLGGKKRKRAVSGTHKKKELPCGDVVPRYFWHLGFSGRPILGDTSRIVLQPRIIISEDGKTPLQSKTRLNSVRRTLTKMWFNDKWRTLVLGFFQWLADNGPSIPLRMAADVSLELHSQPITFELPVSIATDPVSGELDDNQAEEQEGREELLRLTDPAFLKFERDADEETEE